MKSASPLLLLRNCISTRLKILQLGLQRPFPLQLLLNLRRDLLVSLQQHVQNLSLHLQAVRIVRCWRGRQDRKPVLVLSPILWCSSALSLPSAFDQIIPLCVVGKRVEKTLCRLVEVYEIHRLRDNELSLLLQSLILFAAVVLKLEVVGAPLRLLVRDWLKV